MTENGPESEEFAGFSPWELFGLQGKEIERLRQENRRLREALAFAASCIKSGEPWTASCEVMIGNALRAFPHLPPGDTPG